MIEVIHIKKSFGPKVVLDDVSNFMECGKMNLVIGASGSGKTVFLKCMVGLMDVEQGEILYEGKNFTTMNEKERKELRMQIGMLFQGSALFDSLNVERNVMFPLDMFTKHTSAEKLKRVNEVLERVNLTDSNKKYPSEISGGMKKRVALARAIVLNPKFLFCDEPNSGLDPKTSLVIDKLITEITTDFNITTIINTHDMNTVMEYGDNIMFLHQGKKNWQGNKNDIFYSDDQNLIDFIFASDFLKDTKKMKIMMDKKQSN